MSGAAEEMVEETILETEETVVDDYVEEPEYTEVEQEAISQGWNPEGVEGKRNLTAEEFLDRKPLYDKMHKLEKRLKEQDKKFEAMQQHEKMVRDRMHEEHLKELKAAKRAAMENFDYDEVEKLDDEMLKAKEDYAKESVREVPQVESPEAIQATLEDWVDKNPWYNADKVLKRFAEGEGLDFRKANPDASFEEVLAHISKTVKQEFPEKFQNMNRTKPSSVEGTATGGRRTPAAPKQKTVKDLPEEAISVMRTLVRMGTFKTEQDYVNDYFNQ